MHWMISSTRRTEQVDNATSNVSAQAITPPLPARQRTSYEGSDSSGAGTTQVINNQGTEIGPDTPVIDHQHPPRSTLSDSPAQSNQ
jgi:hypothetical protein